MGSRDRSHGNRGVRFWDPDSIGDDGDDPRSKTVLDALPYVKTQERKEICFGGGGSCNGQQV